ncbi:sugar ABC transporter ATP-binding protein, partial [Oceanispirochaeta sp.]|uniref:sugar ABC transporter ATP-binding protein n=1 Tax=Oceanispirochaeta sp. TaxID=2035350 RepID=UPI00262516C7
YYGNHCALKNVSFDLHAGEVLCLVGENGAGKSTLIKSLSGAITPDKGIMIFQDGEERSQLKPRDAMKLGLATIYQDVELIDSLTVADNIFLGYEKKGKFPLFVNTSAQRIRAREILDRLNIGINENMLVEELSAAEKQNLQIVKALHHEAKILILDEPTSSLGLEETRALMSLIGELKRRGLGIVYISHYLEEVFEIADTILVLKDGSQVGTYARKNTDEAEIIRKMVGREASQFYTRQSSEIGQVVLEVENFNSGREVVDVSFSAQSGEILGFGGLVGSGRSELMNLIFGVVKPDSGILRLKGVEQKIHSPKDAIKAGIAMVTEDRHLYAMFKERSVAENISTLFFESRSNFFIDLVKERNLALDMKDRLGIAVADLDNPIVSLSGGNQQKAVIARWLSQKADIFIFDEPTKGVDIGAKQDIYKLMVSFALSGKTVLMVSSDMPELMSLSDRIAIMRNGRLVEILDNKNLSEESLIRYFIGIDKD